MDLKALGFVVVQSPGSGGDRPVLSPVCHLLAIWLWANYLTTVSEPASSSVEWG